MPVDEMSAVRVPTLVLDGGSSPQWIRNAAHQLAKTVRGARHCTLEGQAHAVAPEALAPVLGGFFSGR
jgi:hypothetical protein